MPNVGMSVPEGMTLRHCKNWEEGLLFAKAKDVLNILSFCVILEEQSRSRKTDV